MSLVKAILLGGLLTWIVSLILGNNHARGGFLNVHTMVVYGYDIQWSWPLFLAATGIAWAILAMMPDSLTRWGGRSPTPPARPPR
jgi:hypothetical protein